MLLIGQLLLGFCWDKLLYFWIGHIERLLKISLLAEKTVNIPIFVLFSRTLFVGHGQKWAFLIYTTCVGISIFITHYPIFHLLTDSCDLWLSLEKYAKIWIINLNCLHNISLLMAIMKLLAAVISCEHDGIHQNS